MPASCKATGCKTPVPAELESEGLCVFHFTMSIEQDASAMRRETVMGTATRERQQEIIEYIGRRGERLARVATSGVGLSDELKSRVLATFLTLMNLRENLDRASRRQTILTRTPGTGSFR